MLLLKITQMVARSLMLLDVPHLGLLLCRTVAVKPSLYLISAAHPTSAFHSQGVSSRTL